MFLMGMLLLSSCLENQYRKAWNIISAGKGEWNIDEMTVCCVDLFTETVIWDTTIFDAGWFKFYGTAEESRYDLAAVIPFQNTSIGPYIDYEMTTSSTELYIYQDGEGIFQKRISLQILKIDRNELIMYCPASLNSHMETDDGFSFYFKCSKK
ncbi:MAG: hypothetical protein IPO32_00435 [Crocinitomicaceae bacterium]|nr:hypothetical protein [Crocinitomicaceae bacterium]